MRGFVLLSSTLLVSVPVHASNIATDRPGNGNTAVVVEAQRLNAETGVLYTFVNGSDDHQFSFPVGLRFGIGEGFEARAITSLVGLQSGPTGGDLAWSDTALGMKFQPLQNDGWLPDLALMSDVFFPTGGGAFSSGVVVPEFRAAIAWALPGGLGLFGNLGADVPEDSAGRFARLLHLAQLNFAVPIGSQTLTLFVESYGRTSFDARGDFFQVDAGLMWLFTPDLQLDFFTQHGLDGAVADFSASVGFSFRI